MKIIDAHLHASFDEKTVDLARENGIEYTFPSLQRELTKNNVVGAVLISGKYDPPTPVELDHLTGLAKKDKRLFPVCAINPAKVTAAGFEKLRRAIQKKQVHGIKIFLSYYPLYATDKKYSRFYKLAADVDCPVIFHTGDTFGSEYKVKYAHPLQLDEVAVDFPNTQFVIAHMGNPWIRDAAEVIYKNPNVHVDLSALLIGPQGKSQYLKQFFNDIKFVYEYVDDPSKFMFGTDWPLIRIGEYVKLMKKAIPKRDHKEFFFRNAKRVFKLPV